MCGRAKGGTLNVSLPWCPFSGCCSSLGSKADRLRVGLEVIMHGKKSHVDNDDMQFDLESIFGGCHALSLIAMFVCRRQPHSKTTHLFLKLSFRRGIEK